MSAATLIAVESAASPRLLADVEVADGPGGDDRGSPFERLEAVLGSDFADRLLAALSDDALGRLAAALSPDFTDRIAELARAHGDIS